MTREVSSHPDELDLINLAEYEDTYSVEHYPQLEVLMPAEAALVQRHHEELGRSRLLDIGVGGGKTTVHLAPLAAEYVGIDYAAGLANATARRFPDVRIEQGDVRDLSRFADGAFDTVVFSYNGLDYISHEDRQSALKEVRRVLTEGGLFIFSSHNREYERFHRLPWQGMRQPGRRMLRETRAALRPAARANRRRLRPHEVIHDSWAIVNDEAHGYALLSYYVSIAEMTQQLRDSGFDQVVAHDLYGEPAPRIDTAPWIYYTARAV